MVKRLVQTICPYLILLMSVLSLGGCGRGQAYPQYMRPGLLYLKDQPYRKLYVEVDMVEGAKAPQTWLDELEAFLARYCDKPDGITMVRDEPIPLSEVEGLTAGEAALLYTDGPHIEEGESPAYLHIFFYNHYLSERRRGLSGPKRNPHVSRPCPTTIFFNLDYGHNIAPDYMRREFLQHEAGHVLGLGQNKSHGDGSHCRNRGCLMLAYEGIESELVRLLAAPVGIKFGHHPCKDCLHDVESWQAREVDERLSFAGPFLMRRTEGYAVMRLPNCEIIDISEEPAFQWQRALERAKRQMRDSLAARRKSLEEATGEGQPSKSAAQRRKAPPKGVGAYACSLQASGREDSTLPPIEQTLAALAKATEDPCPVTRAVAQSIREEIKKKSMPPAPAAPESQ